MKETCINRRDVCSISQLKQQMISKSILVLTALSSGLTSYIKYGFNTTNPTEYSFYVLIYGPSVCGGTVLSYDTVLYILSTTHCVLVSNSQSILPPPQMRIISIFDTVMFTSTIKTINPNYQQNGKLDINYDNAVFHLQNLIKKSSSVSRVALWNATIETHPAKGKIHI